MTVNVPINEGDTIILYSDCLVENRNQQGDFLGMDRVIEKVNACSPEATADELIQAFTQMLYDFSEVDSLKDDLTIIVLKKENIVS